MRSRKFPLTAMTIAAPAVFIGGGTVADAQARHHPATHHVLRRILPSSRLRVRRYKGITPATVAPTTTSTVPPTTTSTVPPTTTSTLPPPPTQPPILFAAVDQLGSIQP